MHFKSATSRRPHEITARASTNSRSSTRATRWVIITTCEHWLALQTRQLNPTPSIKQGDDQVKQLLITLHTNLSMVLLKQDKNKYARDAASKAIEIDPSHVKALYRRGVAFRAMGDVDAAKTDLKKAYKLDPSNTAVKKELVGIKKTLEEMKKREKANLQKAFSKGGSSLLYNDKEEAEKKRAREKEAGEFVTETHTVSRWTNCLAQDFWTATNKETKRKEEELKKRKQMWEDECVRRMNSDPKEEVISFEDWDKEREEAEKKEEEKRKKEKREEEKRKQELRRKAREAERANKENNDNESDDELTAEELASLRGYKKTSDGRTTSYFNNELGEKEKELIGSIEPKRIDATPSPNSAADTISGSKVGSVWNQSGTTWEEKDTTEWCKSTLRKCLLETTTAYYSTTSADRTYVAMVKKVKDMTGDASVALAGGKKRYIYDFHLGLDFEITDDDDNVVASSSLKLPDINSTTTAEEELEVDICAWTSGPGDVETDASECRKALVMDVRKSVVKFVELFNAEF